MHHISSNNINSNDDRDTVSPNNSAKTVVIPLPESPTRSINSPGSTDTSAGITKHQVVPHDARNVSIGRANAQRGMKKKETDGSTTTKSRANADSKADPTSNKTSVASSKLSAKNDTGGIMRTVGMSEPTVATSTPKPSSASTSGRKEYARGSKTFRAKTKKKTENKARPPSAQDVAEVPPTLTTMDRAPSSINNGRATSAKRNQSDDPSGSPISTTKALESTKKSLESTKKSRKGTKDGCPPMITGVTDRVLNPEENGKEDDEKMNSVQQQGKKATGAKDDGKEKRGEEEKKSDGEDDDTKPAAAPTVGTSYTIADVANPRSRYVARRLFLMTIHFH